MGDEKHVRNRKKTKTTSSSQKRTVKSSSMAPGKDQEGTSSLLWHLNTAVGLLVMFYLAYKYSKLNYTLHENNLWFTNIKEVEREISFRTESGLYYSYYKQLVNAESLQQGLYELTNDNLTEHTVTMNVLQRMNIFHEVILDIHTFTLDKITYHKGLYELTNDNLTEHTVTMNVLQRMNIYQEVILAFLYRSVPSIKASYKPIFFYIEAIFALNGGLLCSLYLLSWVLGGSWVAGVLATAFYVFNRDDTTRVTYVIPLRESFSLPYLWGQLFFLTLYFRPKNSKLVETLSLAGLLKCTFLFSLFWQFNQFVLLLQAMALFGVQVLQMVPHNKVRTVYLIQLVSLLAVSVLQFFNTMVITGPAFCFVPAALVVMVIQGERPSSSGVILRVIKLIVYILLVFALMISLMKLVKLVIHVDSDEHIYKFVLHKFGIAHSTDFDVSLYVCNGAFEFLTFDVITRLTENFVFPLYAVVQVLGLLLLVCGVFQKWRQESSYKKVEDSSESSSGDYLFKSCPELAYHLIQPVFFGAMAVTTLRMKYIWTPYMCILGSTVLCHPAFYHWVLKKVGFTSKIVLDLVRHAVTLAVLCALIAQCLPPLQKKLEDLREFYDPDTVELMNWVKGNTLPTEALSGSMQLLAGVKLCTNRPVTNHPHYEDNHLRLRTRELYSMYSRENPEHVHTVMVKYNATYIILEDSICLSRKQRCSLSSILDIHMGIMPDAPELVSDISGLVPSDIPRFCDEVRYLREPYSKYFKKVFTNKTFRIYKVLV